MLKSTEFTATLDKYYDLFSDDDMYKFLERSFDELKSLTKEKLEVLLDVIIEHDYLAEALSSHELTMREGVDLSKEMESLEDDEAEAAFVKKVYLDDGAIFDGIYEDAEDFGREYTDRFLSTDDFPVIHSYINYKSFGDDLLNSADFDTHEREGRLFVFRR